MIKYEGCEKRLRDIGFGNQAVIVGTKRVDLFDEIDCMLADERQKQIYEDNKRFLGYVGEDEKQKSDIIYDLLQDSRDFIIYGKTVGRNELRAELRDKVNNK